MSLLTATQNQLSTIRPALKDSGMALSVAKSGAQTIGLVKKKLFVERYKAANPGCTTKKAQDEFNVYRVQTLTAFNAQLATQMASGHIVAKSMRADSDGELKSITLETRSANEKDRVQAAKALTANTYGLSVEELEAFAKQKAAERQKLVGNTLEANTSPATPAAQPEAPANTPTPETPAAPAPANEGQAVATSV